MRTYRLIVEAADGEQLSQGTCWYASPTRVVTAFHVLCNEGSERWFHEDDAGVRYVLEGESGPIELTRDKHDASTDLATLIAPARTDARATITRRAPATHAKWSSDAWPAKQSGEKRCLLGEVAGQGGAGTAASLQLLIKQVDRDPGDASWAGASGAPVIVKGAVVGVITSELENGNTLYAAAANDLQRLLPECFELPIAVVAATGELGGVRDEIARRLERLGRNVRSLEAGDDSASEADKIIVLLGWRSEGAAPLDAQAADEKAISLMLKNPEDFSSLSVEEMVAAKDRLTGTDRHFTGLADAWEIVQAEIQVWLESQQPEGEEACGPDPWEREYLKSARKPWEVGEMKHLLKLAGGAAPERARVYVSLQILPGRVYQDVDQQLVFNEELWARADDELGLESPDDKPPRRPLSDAHWEKLKETGLSAPHVERVLSHRSYQHVVVEGQAGSGKSVLLQHFAQVLADHHLYREPPGNELEPDLLREGGRMLPVPFLVTAGEVAQILREQRAAGMAMPGLATLVRAARAAYEKTATGLPIPECALEKGIRSGRYLLLIDSLDEVADPSERRALLTLLQALVEAEPECRVVLTTRPTTNTNGLKEDSLLKLVRLAPMDDDAAALLVEHWRRERGKSEQYARDFLDAIALLQERHDGLSLRTPLMLTAAILVYEMRDQQLPRDSATLYHNIIETLCSIRKRSQLSAAIKRQVLETLAEGFLRCSPGREWPVTDAARWLHRRRSRIYPSEPEARDGLDELCNDSGLFDWEIRAVGAVVRPPHQTFQEYLAACSLMRANALVDAKADALFVSESGQPPIDDDGWQRVLELLPGAFAVTSVDDAVTYLERLIAHALGTAKSEQNEPLGAYRDPVGLLVRVARAIVEYRHTRVLEGLRDQVVGELLTRFDERGAGWSVARRVAALSVLGELDDPRLERDPWVAVPAGSFEMGGDDEAYQALAGVSFQVPAFDLCWRPVVVADYRRFVEGRGYLEDRWWRDAPEELQAARPWAEPGRWRRQLQALNAPITDVSWWEARAFCRWASVHDRERWRLTGEHALELPSEVQWEYAARHPDGRRFPWGNEEPLDGIDAEANYRIRGSENPMKLCPVGAFPKGNRGPIVDLAGNVWEWCADPWRDAGEREWMVLAETVRDVDNSTRFVDIVSTSGDSRRPRSVRGGSWSNSARRLRCACRLGGEPEGRVYYLGFRVVRLPLPRA